MTQEDFARDDGTVELMTEKSIVLIGMRGSGKTTIGRLLREKTGKQFIDTDDVIVSEYGRAIPDIIKTDGLEHFRNLESKVLEQLSGHRNLIIATGGGSAMRGNNHPHIRNNTICIWLQAAKKDLVARTANDPNRLPLTNKSPNSEIDEIYAQRAPTYGNLADEIVNTEGKTEGEVIDEILQKLQKRHIQ